MNNRNKKTQCVCCVYMNDGKKKDQILWKAQNVPQLLTAADIFVKEVNVRQTTVEITLTYRGTQASNVWFGIGFGSQQMIDTYGIVYQPVSGTLESKFEEHKFGNHTTGTTLPTSFLYRNVVVSGSATTVTVVRPVTISGDNRYYSFAFNQSRATQVQIPVIFARGTTQALQSHGTTTRGSGSITLQYIGMKTCFFCLSYVPIF
ncbi:hypothetical protein RFI_27098 [Reticulomyxa filosa]|uniref:DOMON domain-containing protein n=1 Tax=Reticulomyxa filosa TaxID=46433 RepID=X6MB66_RETFI|nr:hypothetical protein RFI_27098 [Reticulomyxa filosa]|eukprot:ETO10280.1 hypothetical protein RFI_27098 [Reticulomyxa filosa]